MRLRERFIEHMAHFSSSSWAVALSFALVFAGFNPVQQFLAVIFAATSNVAIALNTWAILYVALTFGGLLVPLVLKYVAPRSAFVLSASTYAIFIFSGFILKPWALYLSAAVLGIGAALYWSLATLYVRATTRADHWGKTFSLSSVAADAGGFLGSSIAAIFLARGLSSASLIYMTSVAVLGIVPLLFLPKIVAHPEMPKNPFSALREPSVILLLILPLTTGMYLGLTFSGFLLYAKTSFGLGVLAILAVFPSVLKPFATLFFGWVSDSRDKLSVLWALSALFVLSPILMLLFRFNYVLFGLGMALGLIFCGAVYSVVNSLLQTMVSERHQASAAGLYSFVSSIGVVSAMALSRYADIQSMLWVVLIGAVFDFAAILAVSRSHNQR